MKRILIPATVAGSFLAAGGALAGTVTSNMTVQMSVVASCTVTVGGALDFGNNNAVIDITSPINAQQNILVTCTNGAPYNVRLDGGQNAGAGGISDRKMLRASGTETINYQLYRDSGRTQVWGETDLTDTLDDTGDGNLKTHIVYGQVPNQNDVRVGNYTDTILVTVNY